MAVHGPEEKRLSPLVAVIGFVATAAIAFLIGYFVAKPASLQDIPDSTGELANAAVDSGVLPVKGSPTKGEHTAAVTIVEFGDFQCTACRGAADALLNRAVREYGKENIRVVWKHLPLSTHPDARLASQASWAAGQQGKFWEYHDKIFAEFPKDAKDGTIATFLKPDALAGYAADLSLDVEKFKADLNSAEAKAAVDADVALADSLGLRSTPTMFVNGRKVSFKQGVSFDALKQVVDEELGKSRELMATPNAYYTYAVWFNGTMPDGIQRETTVARGDAAVAAGNVEARPGAQQADARPQPRPEAAPRPGSTGPDPATLPMKGAANAKVTILEFSDFQCPFCGKVNPAISELMKAYPNDLRIGFAQFPLDFHKDAPLAGQASLAAHEQGKFWEYHDLLFDNQRAIQRADLEKYAEQLGLNMGKFRSALDSGKFQKTIDSHLADGRSFGITGTPSFLINGRKFVGAQPVDNFKKIIDEEIKRADQLAAQKKLSGDALYVELVKTAPREAAPPKQDAAAAPEDDGRHFVPTDRSPIYGDPNAPVTVVEFSDFECPFCSRGAATIKELVNANPRKVKAVFKHFPLDFHKNAPLASRASIAAQQQGKFWEYHDLLFANQKALQKDKLIEYAQQLQLNMDKFKADLDNEALDRVIAADQAAGAKVQVRGTPHFFINGTRLSGAQPLQAFQAALDKELKIAEDFIKKGTPKDKLYETIVKEMKTQAPPPVEVDIKGSPAKGNPKAPVTIIEFSDFQCPFCSKVNPAIDQVLKEYPGKVQVVFKHQPLAFHADAPLAAEASLAAHAQGKFWEFHDLLFANQKAIKRPDLEGYAEQLGLNMSKFKGDLDSGKFKKAVENDMAQARSAGISGTPSFLINGKKFVGAQPYESFKAEIDAALAK